MHLLCSQLYPQPRVTNSSWFAGTVLVSALKVPCTRRPPCAGTQGQSVVLPTGRVPKPWMPIWQWHLTKA